RDSTPSYPQPLKAPKGAPNVLVILLDDVGFGHTSTFGGPVPTPTLDRLAKNELMYNTFHTTALCSPTRAALLTGRNHHSAGTGVIIELGTGFPGYTGIIPQSTAMVPEILRDNGYATAMFGKAHNTPEMEISPAGPYQARASLERNHQRAGLESHPTSSRGHSRYQGEAAQRLSGREGVSQ